MVRVAHCSMQIFAFSEFGYCAGSDIAKQNYQDKIRYESLEHYSLYHVLLSLED
jgi:hypothetical protein